MDNILGLNARHSAMVMTVAGVFLGVHVCILFVVIADFAILNITPNKINLFANIIEILTCVWAIMEFLPPKR